MIKTAFFWVLRFVCYGGLLLIIATGVALLVASGDCPRFNEAGVTCNSVFSQQLAEFALGVVLISAFTGVPLALALGGLVFLVKDIRAWWRARKAK